MEELGLPSPVRIDRGGENVRVADLMLSHPGNGPGRGSFITGHSPVENVYGEISNGIGNSG